MHMESTSGGSIYQGHTHTDSPLTLSDPSADLSRGNTINSPEMPPPHAGLVAENRELRAELDSLRAERAHMAEILARLTEVLGSKCHDRLVHDVRNVLNERELYRALADTVM